MPVYEPDHIEFDITTGFIQIVADSGEHFRAYDARPTLGGQFPGVALIHDWWGLTGRIRRMANHFAQSGYQVIVPDLFDGEVATTPEAAMKLLKNMDETKAIHRVNRALDVLEKHHRSNHDVAAIGIGMGGGFAFDAAIIREDLEGAIAIAGFPQNYIDNVVKSNTPIMAIYGEYEEFIPHDSIKALSDAFSKSELTDKHELVILKGMKHEIFPDNPDEHQREKGREALKVMKVFLHRHLSEPHVTSHRPSRK